MPFVTVTLREGRSVEQKRRMVKALTDVMVETLGARPEVVTVIIYDVPDSNVARAGVLAYDKVGGAK